MTRRNRPSPRKGVALELLRALGSGAALPWRVLDYCLCREALREELVELTRERREPAHAPEPPPLPPRALRVLLSCAEASGEIHAASLALALEEEARAAGAPRPELRGFGGERLAAAGVEVLADPVARSTMGFAGVAGALPFYVRLLERAGREAAEWQPDVFVPVDSPALHVPMARCVRAAGCPVVHFVTPQLWGWAPWRAAGYRRAVDRALTILPFEPAWFRRREVAVGHVGHPLLDALRDVPATVAPETAPLLALLPGSRASVIERNLPWMLGTVASAAPRLAGAEVSVLQQDDRHRERIERALAAGPIEARLEIGDLHSALGRARAALSVSGTVLIDVLHHRLPTVVIYRIEGLAERWMARALFTPPFFASPNLLAAEEVLPEFCFAGEGPREAVAGALVRAWSDARWRTRCREGLARAAERLGPPGAVARAARHALEVALARPEARDSGREKSDGP